MLGNPTAKAVSPRAPSTWSPATEGTAQKKREEVAEKLDLKVVKEGFPGGAVVKNSPPNAGGTGLSPGLGRSHMRRSS